MFRWGLVWPVESVVAPEGQGLVALPFRGKHVSWRWSTEREDVLENEMLTLTSGCGRGGFPKHLEIRE